MNGNYLITCPYLPLTSVFKFGEWLIGPLGSFQDEWVDPGFQNRCQLFLSAFEDTLGRRIENPTIVVHQVKGIDGTKPTDAVITAMQTALDFAVLDANPYFDADSLGQDMATSDNSELYVWHLAPDGWVAIEAGEVVKTLSGGWNIFEKGLAIRPPLELHLPATVHVDEDVLDAAYSICVGKYRRGSKKRAKRAALAIRWFAKAWRNSSSIGWDDRTIFLKTAFEVFTGSSRSASAATWLANMFTEIASDRDKNSRLLWSLSEEPRRTRSWFDKKTKRRRTQRVQKS